MTTDSRTILARLDARIEQTSVELVQPTPTPVEPVETRQAASVLLLREAASGLEVFVQHRRASMAFAAGMVTFPGGGRELDDATLADCAVRELAEETGVVLDSANLHLWAHWITPEGQPIRYDTVFFVAALTDDQLPTNRTSEAESADWVGPVSALAEVTAGRWAMLPPTRSLIMELAESGSVAEVLRRAEGRVVGPVLPVAVRDPGAGWRWHYPGPGDPITERV